MPEYGGYKRNQSKDGYMPCCYKCGEEFDDGEIFEAKNYPSDGIIAVFFTCPKCEAESEFIYKMEVHKDLQKNLGKSEHY